VSAISVGGVGVTEREQQFVAARAWLLACLLTWAMACLTVTAPRAAAQRAQPAIGTALSRDTTTAPPPQTNAPPGAPVVVRLDTILFVPTRSGAFSAADRAEAIADRVREAVRRAGGSVEAVVNETSTDLMVGDRIVMTVTDADAAALGKARTVVVSEDSMLLHGALITLSTSFTMRTVAYGVLWTLIATAAIVVILAIISRVFPRIAARLESWRGTRIPAFRVQSFEMLSSSVITDGLLAFVRLVRIALIVLLLFFYLPLVFSFFPWTRHLSDSLLGYVARPVMNVGQALLDYLPNVLFIVVIVIVARYAIMVVHLVFGAIERGSLVFRGFERDWADPTYKIVRFLIIAFTMVVLFPYLPGSSSDAFKGISIFLGLLVSLGSSSAISNIVAGVVLTYTRAFNVGDRVSIGDTTGDVVARTLLVTRVRTIKNVDITIPNAMVLSSHVMNYTAAAGADGLILHTTVTIGYDAPWQTVQRLLLGAARSTEHVRETPEPFVLQTSLDDFYVTYELNAHTDQPQVMARTYSSLHANILDAFAAAGVEIMSPHYGALRDGNASTIPGPARNGGAPPFRVHVSSAGVTDTTASSDA
jgi:small-conductance mechanosensitive channel